MDLAKVTVGEEGDGEGLATCGRAVRRRTMAARSRQQRREAVEVQLRRAGQRGSQGEASGAGELVRDGR